MMVILGVLMTNFFVVDWGLINMAFVLALVLSFLVFNQSFFYGEAVSMMTDNVSILMVILSILLCFLAVMCSPNIKDKSYLFLIMLLSLSLIMAFFTSSFLMFYVFFEMSLIPTLLLIIGWGYQPERLQAGSHMMLYTVGASLPLLLLIINTMMTTGSLSIYVLMLLRIEFYSFWFFVAMVTAFLVKLPIYSFHLWLPKAHVEAPLAGSMVLAGILLKLGGYGLYLVYLMFCIRVESFELMLVVLSLWGGFMASLMCLRQTDLKAFVAYSSVAHMGIVVAAVFMNTLWGMMSLKIIMFAHGITSPSLFFLAYITYMKLGSRSLMYMGGLLIFCPLLSLLWFLSLSANMAAPPTLNLIGEMVIMPVLWVMSFYIVVIMMILMLFSAIYNMYLYSMVNHGGINKLSLSSTSVKSSDYLGLLCHMMPLLMILKMGMFSF